MCNLTIEERLEQLEKDVYNLESVFSSMSQRLDDYVYTCDNCGHRLKDRSMKYCTYCGKEV